MCVSFVLLVSLKKALISLDSFIASRKLFPTDVREKT